MVAHEKLKDWRENKRKITQAEASREVEVSQATWCEWEKGTKVPRVDAAVHLEKLTKGAVKVTDWAKALEVRHAKGAA